MGRSYVGKAGDVEIRLGCGTVMIAGRRAPVVCGEDETGLLTVGRGEVVECGRVGSGGTGGCICGWLFVMGGGGMCKRGGRVELEADAEECGLRDGGGGTELGNEW